MNIIPKNLFSNLTVGNKTVELPVLVIPGMNADTIAIAVGYGRSEKLGKNSSGCGTKCLSICIISMEHTVDYFAT